MAIKIIKIDENTAVDESGCKYMISNDIRGANEKLWLHKENGAFTDSFLIKFSTRKPNTICELNFYNEVVCSRICKELGLEHVDYEFCEFVDLDGKSRMGVVCQNYKHTPNRVETSGRTLHEFYKLYCCDNNYGIVPNIEINTVYAYIEQLKSRYESRRMTMSEETENRLIDEMLTLALFDFCTCQIDRHWGNVGWLNNNMYDDEKFKIRLVPIYDNECSFLLDDATEESLSEFVKLINSPKKLQVAKDMVNRKKTNSPYFGVRTSLVRVKDENKGFLVPRSNVEENLSNAALVARELAHEIKTRPYMKQLYEKLMAFDMEEFLKNIDCIPESEERLKQVYSFVWNTRVNLLAEYMEQSKKYAEGEEVNEKGLSSL